MHLDEYSDSLHVSVLPMGDGRPSHRMDNDIPVLVLTTSQYEAISVAVNLGNTPDPAAWLLALAVEAAQLADEWRATVTAARQTGEQS